MTKQSQNDMKRRQTDPQKHMKETQKEKDSKQQQTKIITTSRKHNTATKRSK